MGEDEVQQFATIDDLEKLYREAGQRLLRYRFMERQNGICVASQKQFLMVLGAPGAGKSTFLRKIGLESFKGKNGNFKHQAIPVLLELKNKKFTESKIDLKALIEAEFTTCGFPKPKEFTERALDQGKSYGSLIFERGGEIGLKLEDEQRCKRKDRKSRRYTTAICRTEANGSPRATR